MPVISTNIAANSAVRYLNINSADQTSSLSKLASGSRISQASDDAAGLAISTRISSDVTALTQAATNASHGISVLQTADGGASNISDILQRMKALASQSASGTVTDTERAYIDAEFSQLVDEVDGISTGTRYNGQSLLDGTSAFANSGVSVMVGSNAADTITVTLNTLTAAGLKLTTTDGATSEGVADAGTAGKAVGSDITAGVTIAGSGGTAATEGTSTGSVDISGGITTTGSETLNIKIDGDTTGIDVTFAAGTYTQADILADINTALGANGTASVDGSGNLVITSASTGASSTVEVTGGASFAGTVTEVDGAAAGAGTAGETMTITIDGTAYTANFSLTGSSGGDADYTAQDILDTINTAIGTAGTATLDATGKLQITSATTGTTSSVKTSGAASLGTLTSTAGSATTATSTSATSVGGVDVETAGVTLTAAETLTVSIDDKDYTVNFSAGANSAADILSAINDELGDAGTASFDAAGRLQVTAASVGVSSSVTMSGAASIIGASSVDVAGQGGSAPADIVSTLTEGITVTGNSLSFDVTTGVDAAGKDITSTVTLTRSGGTNSDGVYSLDDIAAAINTAVGATSTLSASLVDGKLTLSNTATGKDAVTRIDNFVGTDFTVDDLGLTDNIDATAVSVSSQDDANAAIAIIDAAIDVVSRARANIGALESRFSFRSDSIATSIENLEAANSAITDTDVASESAKLASAKVKTQAAVAAAAQASQMPQDLLKLLQ